MKINDDRYAGLERLSGLTIAFDPKRAGKGQAWGICIDLTLANGQRKRPSKWFGTLEAARKHYPLAVAEVNAIRAEQAEEARKRQALNLPELPKAPKGCILFGADENVVGSPRNWLREHVKEMNAPGTYKFYKDLLDGHLFPIMATWPVTDEVMTLQRLIELLRVTLFEKRITLGRREACRACLSAYFGWAITWLPPKQLTQNPLKPAGAAAGKKDRGFQLYIRNKAEKGVNLKKTPNPMNRTQYEAFLDWQQEHRPDTYFWFLFQGDVGPRVSEVSALKIGNLFLDQAVPQAHICESYSDPKRWLELQENPTSRRLPEPTDGEKETKTNRQNQYVDLTPRVVTAAKAERKANLARWMAAGRPGKEPGHAILNSALMPRRPDKTVYEAFRAGCDALQLRGADGRPFSQGDLRDTFATLAILDGHHIGWVANQMGDDEETVRVHYYKWIRKVDPSPLYPAKKDTK